MTKVAVVLSGCGHIDGAEIRESVITLLELDKAGAEVSIFAPDIEQRDVINHLTGEAVNETRNVLVEAARIARGKIKPLSEAKAADFDALLLPGGFGAVKNLSDVAIKGADAEVLPEFKKLVVDFAKAKKPIGAICISPAVLTAALQGVLSPTVTIGDDADGLIKGLGGVHQPCATSESTVDDAHNIVSCSAYMRGDAALKDVAAGIEKVVREVMKRAV